MSTPKFPTSRKFKPRLRRRPSPDYVPPEERRREYLVSAGRWEQLKKEQQP